MGALTVGQRQQLEIIRLLACGHSHVPRAVRTTSGLSLVPDESLTTASDPDILLVPGGPGGLRPDPARLERVVDAATAPPTVGAPKAVLTRLP